MSRSTSFNGIDHGEAAERHAAKHHLRGSKGKLSGLAGIAASCREEIAHRRTAGEPGIWHVYVFLIWAIWQPAHRGRDQPLLATDFEPWLPQFKPRTAISGIIPHNSARHARPPARELDPRRPVGAYRDDLRYPSDVTDANWPILSPANNLACIRLWTRFVHSAWMAFWQRSPKRSGPSTTLKPSSRSVVGAVLRRAASTCGGCQRCAGRSFR